eukprot:14793460-Alexandrium_andersonii.AAC.1
MSASLVGSEMCIRDSAWTCGMGVSDFRRFRAAERAVCPVGRAGTAATSVSYTHLTLPTICSV